MQKEYPDTPIPGVTMIVSSTDGVRFCAGPKRIVFARVPGCYRHKDGSGKGAGRDFLFNYLRGRVFSHRLTMGGTRSNPAMEAILNAG